MRWSLLLAALSSAVAVVLAKTEESKPSESDSICPRPELLRPCKCLGDNETSSIHCFNVTQPFDLKTMFGRLSAERSPKTKLKFYGIVIAKAPTIESIEFNSTGSAQLKEVELISLANLVKIHEGAFIGTENSITILRIQLDDLGNNTRVKWQPNLPSPYNWLGLVRRFKSLEELKIYTQKSVHPFTREYHLPSYAFSQNNELASVIIANKPNRVTIESRAFAGCRHLTYVLLTSVDWVPAEILADLSSLPTHQPLFYQVFRLRLITGNITESSFDPRAFAGCCRKPVHLELTKNPIKSLPEAVFRQFFDGHPDNMVNIGRTQVDSRTPDNAWWANSDVYKWRVLNFTFKELHQDDERESAFPVELLGRFNKWKPNSTISISTTTTRPRRQSNIRVDESDDPMFMGLDDVDPIF